MTESKEHGDAEELYEQFASQLLQLIRGWVAEPFGRAHVIERRPVFKVDNEFPTWSEVETPDFNWTVVSHLADPFWSSDLALNCAHEHFRRGIYPGSLWLNRELDESMVHNIIHSYLPQPIILALREGGGQTSLDEVMAQYRALRDSWTSRLTRFEVSIPLLGLTGQVADEEFQAESHIADRLRLSRMSGDDKTRLWTYRTEPPDFARVDEESLGRVQYHLAGTFEEDLPRQFPSQALANDLYQFVLALRLLKAGDVGVDAIFRTALEPRVRDVTEAFTFPYLTLGPFSRPFVLMPGDLTKVRRISDVLRDLEASGGSAALDMALYRFVQSYSRLFPADRVLDFTIALEACLLKNESELGYKFSMRGAALLARAGLSVPETTGTLLGSLYKARSKIVHEGKSVSEVLKLEDVKETAAEGDPLQMLTIWEDLAREILRAFVDIIRRKVGANEGRKIKPGKLMDDIRGELDDQIIGGLQLLYDSQQNDTSA
jgi:hypothetical protein